MISITRFQIFMLFTIFFSVGGTLGAAPRAATLVLSRRKSPGAMVIRFGKVLSGQRVSANFKLVNQTGAAVELVAIPDCGCIKVKLQRDALRPGQSAKGKLWFNTAARNGSVGVAATGFTLRDVMSRKTLGIGTVLARLQPSVSLSTSKLRWSLVPGQRAGARTVQVRNSLPVAVDMSWPAPRLKNQWLYSISPAFEKIPAHSSGKLVIRPARATERSLYLSKWAYLRFRVAGPTTTTDIKPWKLMLALRAMPNIPFVVVPGSIILTASDFSHGVAYRNIHVDQAAGSNAAILGVTPTDPHLSVRRLRPGVYRLRVQEPTHAIIGRLRIAYRWGSDKSVMGVGVFVYKP